MTTTTTKTTNRQQFSEGDIVQFTSPHPAHPKNEGGVLRGGIVTVGTNTEGQVYEVRGRDRILVLIRRERLPYLWAWTYPARIETCDR